MKKTNGNLVDMFMDGKFDVLIHGCNCFKTMGAGIAKEISEKIPEANMADNMYSFEGDYAKLSNWSYATVRRSNGPVGIVINLYTQYNPGADLFKEALLLGFKKLRFLMKTDIKIAIPLIGCGIAGGNWDEIEPLINEIMKDHDITVVHYQPEKKLKSVK
jgi:O-acetyl-ADP-ribose deacetylase (regulator of RNase III)